jgi:hypothetical protein
LYSLEYPDTWYDLAVMGGADLETQKSFTNENMGSPEGMDANGVFVTIRVDSNGSRPCAQGAGATDSNITTVQISIDGVSTVEYLFLNGAGTVVKHNDWCYRFSILTDTAANRDRHRDEIAHILSSFKFNR